MRNQRGNFEQNINVIPNSNHDRIAAPYQILVSNPKRNIIIIVTPVTGGIFYWEIRKRQQLYHCCQFNEPVSTHYGNYQQEKRFMRHTE